MCGIVGIISGDEVWYELLDSLVHLQHRGQDAAGIVTANSRFYTHRGKGLVREVFSELSGESFKGCQGIGHVRYPTKGSKSFDEIQPFWTSAANGVSLAHNGNLTNDEEIKSHLTRRYHFHINSESDSELLLYLFANALLDRTLKSYSDFFDVLESTVSYLFQHAKGAYSVVTNILGKGVCGFRDPHGIRPLIIGVRDNEDGKKDYILASETTMFYQLGFSVLDDVKPGEVVYIDNDRNLHRSVLTDESFNPCIFEYVYFARPDAMINDVSVYRSRLRMGQNLATLWREQYPDAHPDVVIPVPFSSNTAALSFANALGVRYTEGLYKNPFIGRTFIMPSKRKRQQSVRYKLSPQETEIRGKRVMLVDDSIVRGTTSKEIIAMVREHGAKEVYFASACPEVKFPCFYGIDMPTQEELLASSKSLDEIKAYLNVDKLIYQQIEPLKEAIMRKGKYKITTPCMACLDGQYICKKATASNHETNSSRR